MKREGWQHGSVRSIAKAGGCESFAMAPASKPSNHSKHSGKCKKARCPQCHSHPVTKSRDKAKGTYKLRSADVVLNHRLLSWRVAGAGTNTVAHWPPSGVSATGMLDVLLADSCCSQLSENDDPDPEYSGGFDPDLMMPVGGEIHEEEEEEGDLDDDEGSDINIGADHGGDDDDDDEMEFCHVGFIFEYMEDDEEDEDWCVVDEM